MTKNETPKLFIIADDFTGALDTGVQFAMSGAKTHVAYVAEDLFSNLYEGTNVIVVDAESRHLPPKQAYKCVFDIAKKAIEYGIPYIYKKTDSALRGNIGAELTALLDASGEEMLPFLPAFPQINRCTKNGIHYIDNKEVSESIFGEDPFDPVLTSHVDEIIHRQSEVYVTSRPALRVGETLSSEKGIVVFDAADTAELEHTAKQLITEKKARILSGCAGLATVLPSLISIEGEKPVFPKGMDEKLFVICGSVNAITRGQLDFAEQDGFYRICLTPEQKLKKEYWETDAGRVKEEKIREQILNHPYVILDSNDLPGGLSTADWAVQNGISIDEVRVGVSRSLGLILTRVIESKDMGTLFITGGDTLVQCMKMLGVSELEPLMEVDVGVVLSRFKYHDSLRYVISKSGGFGGRELFVKLAKLLKSEKGKGIKI